MASKHGTKEIDALRELRARLNLPPNDTNPLDYEPTPLAKDTPVAPEFAHKEASGWAYHFSEAPQSVRESPAEGFDPQNDATLCRFLRARNYNVDDALAMLNACLAHRATWTVDTLLQEPDPLEPMWQDCVPISFCGHDRLGRPVLIERTGTVPMPQMMRHIGHEDFFYRHVRHMELVERQIAAASRLFGKHVSQVVIIMDLKGMSFRLDGHALPLFRLSAHIDQDYHPECLAGFFIVNAPWIFKPLWALARPFLNAKTAAKFHILGSNYASTLLQYINADQLPVEYGGTSTVEVPPFKPLGDSFVCPPERARVFTVTTAKLAGVDITTW